MRFNQFAAIESLNTFDIFTQIYKKGLTKMFEEMVSLKLLSNFFPIYNLFILISWSLDYVLVL